jgi:hypothetical protein
MPRLLGLKSFVYFSISSSLLISSLPLHISHDHLSLFGPTQLYPANFFNLSLPTPLCKMESSTERITPAQRALAIPEVLSTVFTQPMTLEGNTGSRQANLLQWALVNSRWYAEAMRVLWARPHCPLESILGKIPPERRQLYADCVLWARVLQFTSIHSDPYVKNTLYGLMFPKMTRVFVSIYTSEFCFCVVPREERPRVIHFERRVTAIDRWTKLDSILRQISVSGLLCWLLPRVQSRSD